jgi:hypothetical protein
MNLQRLVMLLCVAFAPRVWAIRPFITDDARVVGRRLLQLETWAQVDESTFQHWVLPAFGPTDQIELTVGAVHGAVYGREPVEYAINGPLLQMKILLYPAQPNRWPGVALAGGALLPFGRGGFEPPRASGFVYVAFTESLFSQERLLVHANIGVSLPTQADGAVAAAMTAGLGAQLRLIWGLHAVAEIVHGDAYTGSLTGAFQSGFRYIFSDHVQLDMTAGAGLWGDPRRPPWASIGIRLVSSPLW